MGRARGSVGVLSTVPAPRTLVRALANLATTGRLLLVVPTAAAILHDRALIALALVAVAVATDLVDGWLARQFGTTVLGSWLDVTADRLLIAAVVAALWWSGGLATWITLVLVAREALVGLGALVTFAPRRPMKPILVGKVHTALAFLLLVTAVAASGGFAPTALVDVLGVLVTLTAVVSVGWYAWRLRP
jgi:phosphatidylglycerophosphate synthase